MKEETRSDFCRLNFEIMASRSDIGWSETKRCMGLKLRTVSKGGTFSPLSEYKKKVCGHWTNYHLFPEKRELIQ